ncbi:MAG: biopolymer transporter ExbD [Betaproteobacteria bacterium]|nr:biopolymer transporter ExbD [Betaproteobacteria bacterium]
MGMSIGGDDDDDSIMSDINTTPLVDIMLVLLIIFLITIPAIVHTVAVELPKETNVVTVTKPENILISVDKDGDVYWGSEKLADMDALFDRLKVEAVKNPQPEVHIRGDLLARYESIGRVVYTCQRASILKVGFITEPPPRT